jgi:cytochrome P460
VRHSFLLLLGGILLGTTGRFVLPEPMSGYRSWRSQSPAARPVPPELAALCAPISKRHFEAAFAAAHKVHGPHTGRYVRVFFNPAAYGAFADSNTSPFPVGAVIAKEKLVRPEDSAPEAIAFMIKHGPGEFAESGGWEFRFYPMLPQASYTGCIECHRAGAPKDFVFSRPELSRTTRR